VQQTSDGGCIVACIIETGMLTISTKQWHWVKLDSSGNTVWERTYGGSGEEWAGSILATGDGGFIGCGYSNSTDIPGVANSGLFDGYIVTIY
jgi:hypothetical protein